MVSASVKPFQFKSKLCPPRHGRAFDRRRLFQVLDEMSDRAGLWIYGPPGIGKTTLVTTYLDARSNRYLWLQLDAGDSDPAVFLQLLTLAVNDVVSAQDTSTDVPADDDLCDIPRLFERRFRWLADALPPPWVLVLDNVQVLGDAAQLHAGLAAMISILPEGMQIICISRDPPPSPFGMVIARQQLGLIGADRLRFTVLETGELVVLHCSESPIEELYRLTDGWPAAMILILAAGGLARSGSVAINMQARQHLFALFAGEVLDQMSPVDVRTLEHIAWLPHATESMAMAVSGNAHAGDLLADLTSRSLFTYKQDQAQPVYSFHALFADFLRHRLGMRLSPVALHKQRMKVTQLLMAHDQLDAAIVELIGGREWELLIELINEHAARYVEQGRIRSVQSWVKALPEPYCSLPGTYYWSGICQLSDDPAAALQAFEKASLRYSSAGDASGSFHTAAAAADAIVTLGVNLDLLDPWLEILECHAVEHLREHRKETDLLVIPGLLAALVYRRTEHSLVPKLVALAEELMDEPRGASQRIMLGTTALYLLWSGQLMRLERVMLKLDKLCESQHVAAMTRLRWYSTGVLVRSLLGHTQLALRDARCALALTRDNPALQTRASLLMALACVAARDASLAREHLDLAVAGVGPGTSIDLATYEFQRGLQLQLSGDRVAAARLMRQSLLSGRRCGWPLREHIALLGCTLTTTETGCLDEANRLMDEVKDHPFHAVCRWHQWLSAMIEANLADRTGDLPRCLAALRQACALCAEYGFDSGPLLYSCGNMMPRLCAVALSHDIGMEQMTGIIRRHGLPAPDQGAEHWPWPVRIFTLGRFALEFDEQRVQPPRKESRKALDLLKLLVTLGRGDEVATDRLTALLWPDSDSVAARQSFENTLFRLRKIVGENQLRLRAGMLSLNLEHCWSDLNALELALDTPLPIDGDNAVIQLELILRLYGGPFLPGEERYASVVLMRDRLQSRFLRRMEALGSILEAEGRCDVCEVLYRRVIEQNPLAENIYRRLIACLLQLDSHAEALDVYRRCRQQLSVVLGIQPSPATEALVSDLRRGVHRQVPDCLL